MKAELEKLNQLSYLAKNEPWSDKLERAWVNSLLLINNNSSFHCLASQLHNEAKQLFYKEIIRNNVKGKTILEIGTGTGAHTIACIKAGAKEVISYERNPDIAKVARQTFQRNGVSDKIKIVETSSLEMTPKDVEGCDIILHDLFEQDPFENGNCEILAHVRTILPKARFLPEAIEIQSTNIDRSKLKSSFLPLPSNDEIDLSPLERARTNILMSDHISSDFFNDGLNILKLNFEDLRPLQSFEESFIGPRADQVAILWYRLLDQHYKYNSWNKDSNQLIWLPPTGANQIKVKQLPHSMSVTAI